jgi:hypothetical protein
MICRLLVASGSDGIAKIVGKFIEMFPTVSKRQVEFKINEVAVKEKRATDAQKVWHIKREFEHLLEDEKEPSTSTDSKKKTDTSAKKRKSDVAEVKTPSQKKRPAEPKEVTEEAIDTTAASKPVATPKTEKKQKTAFEIFVKEKRSEVEEALGPGVDVSFIDLSLSDSYLERYFEE